MTKMFLGLRTRLKFVLGYATIGGGVPYDWWRVPYDWWRDPYNCWQINEIFQQMKHTLPPKVGFPRHWSPKVQILPPIVGYPATNCSVPATNSSVPRLQL